MRSVSTCELELIYARRGLKNRRREEDKNSSKRRRNCGAWRSKATTYPISIGIGAKGKYKAHPFFVAYVTRRFSDTTRCLLGTGVWLLGIGY